MNTCYKVVGIEFGENPRMGSFFSVNPHRLAYKLGETTHEQQIAGFSYPIHVFPNLSDAIHFVIIESGNLERSRWDHVGILECTYDDKDCVELDQVPDVDIWEAGDFSSPTFRGGFSKGAKFCKWVLPQRLIWKGANVMLPYLEKKELTLEDLPPTTQEKEGQ